MAGSVRITDVNGRDGLQGLIADLQHEAQIAPSRARKVVQKGLLNIKNDWRGRWSGIAHAPTIPYTITYDSFSLGARAGGEVGPDKDKQVGGGPHRTPGNLGALLEFGGPKNAPIPGGLPALEAERPRFEKALEDLGFAGPSWR